MLVHRRVVDALLNYWPQGNVRYVANNRGRSDLGHDIVTLHIASLLGKVVYLSDLLIKHRRHQRNTWSPELAPSLGSSTPEFDRRVEILHENARSGVIKALMYEERAGRAKAKCDAMVSSYLSRVAGRELRSAKFFAARAELYSARSTSVRVTQFSNMLRKGTYKGGGGALATARCTLKDLAFTLAGPVALRMLETVRKHCRFDFDPRELLEQEKFFQPKERIDESGAMGIAGTQWR